MVPDLEVELVRGADVLEHHEVVLATRRGFGLDDVRDLLLGAQQLGVGLGLLGLGLLDLGGEVLGAGQQLVALLALGLADLLAELLLLGAQRVGSGHRGPATLVGGEQRVHEGRVLTSGALRGAHGLRVIAKRLEVDHSR